MRRDKREPNFLLIVRTEGFEEIERFDKFETTTNLIHRLLRGAEVLNALGRRTPFEIAVGMNGRVWVKCADVTQTIVIANAIASSENLLKTQIEPMVARLWAAISTYLCSLLPFCSLLVTFK